MKEFVLHHVDGLIGFIIPIVTSLAIDWAKRKWPGATPLFQAIDDKLDKTPGFKNKP